MHLNTHTYSETKISKDESSVQIVTLHWIGTNEKKGSYSICPKPASKSAWLTDWISLVFILLIPEGDENSSFDRGGPKSSLFLAERHKPSHQQRPTLDVKDWRENRRKTRPKKGSDPCWFTECEAVRRPICWFRGGQWDHKCSTKISNSGCSRFRPGSD